MGEWYSVVKTIRGNRYLYMQRTTYRKGQTPKTESYSMGALEPKRKKSRVHKLAIALVGVVDEYDRPHDSLLNRHREAAHKAAEVETQVVSSGAGNEESK